MEPGISSFLSYLGSLNIITDFNIPRKRVDSIGKHIIPILRDSTIIHSHPLSHLSSGFTISHPILTNHNRSRHNEEPCED